MLEIVKNTKIDFMGKRKFAFVFSGILAIIGIFAIVQMANGRANLGIDFAGGTAIQLKFEKPVNIGAVRKALADGGVRDFDLQEFAAVNKILIRVKTTEQNLGQIAD